MTSPGKDEGGRGGNGSPVPGLVGKQVLPIHTGTRRTRAVLVELNLQMVGLGCLWEIKVGNV